MDLKVTPRLGTLVAGLAVVLTLACSGSEPQFTPTQLAERVRSGLSEQSVLDRQLAVAPLLEELQPENVEAVRTVYLESAAWLSPIDIEIFVDAWARFDGLAAYGFARRAQESLKAPALVAALHAWAMSDLPHALRVVNDLVQHEPKFGQQLVEPMVRGWVHSRHTGLEEFLLENPETGELLNAAIPEFYRTRGADGFRQWVEQLILESEDPTQQWMIFRKAARAYGLRDPEEAALWVKGLYGQADYARDGPESVALAWLRTDPVRAFEWLRFEAPEGTSSSVPRAVFQRWFGMDWQQAKDWLEAQPDESFYHATYDGFARQIAKSKPQNAIVWCKKIEPRDVQLDCLTAVAGTWYGEDPVAAGLWMEDSPIEPDALEEIRTRWQRRWKRKPQPARGQ